jgi:hypothetical protein
VEQKVIINEQMCSKYHLRIKTDNVRKGSSRKGKITGKRQPTYDSPQKMTKDENKDH